MCSDHYSAHMLQAFLDVLLFLNEIKASAPRVGKPSITHPLQCWHFWQPMGECAFSWNSGTVGSFGQWGHTSPGNKDFKMWQRPSEKRTGTSNYAVSCTHVSSWTILQSTIGLRWLLPILMVLLDSNWYGSSY